MKVILRILFWCIVFVAACLLFCLADTETKYADNSVCLTVLTEGRKTTMSMEDYLFGALGAEMPASFAPEALKAQAVAIRSYVFAGTKHGSMTVCTDSTCCIGYRTPAELRALWETASDSCCRKLWDAVRSTDGEYLTYNGQTAQTVFHASSFGTTEDSAAIWSGVPYLVSVDTPETGESVRSVAVFSPEELAAALGLSGVPDRVEKVAYETSGRVQSVQIAGKIFSGTELRSLLGLAGTDFTVCLDGRDFVFTVHGSGHGVGMSQTGANIFAAGGWDYRAILSHYYPGTELTAVCLPSQ